MLPCASVALQLTVVSPSGNVSPELWLHDTASLLKSTMSEADVEKVAAALDGPVASTVFEAGTVTTGFVVSTTVTVNEAVLVFPCVSVALQLTVVVPNANVEPDAGVQLSVATACSDLSQLLHMLLPHPTGLWLELSLLREQ